MSVRTRRGITTIGPSISNTGRHGKKTRLVEGVSHSRQPLKPLLISTLSEDYSEVPLECSYIEDTLQDEVHPSAGDSGNLPRTTKAQSDFFEEWRKNAPEYLSAILASESMDQVSLCTCDGGDLAVYKCRTCTVSTAFCRSCIVAQHAANPFHSILYWNGKYFEDAKHTQLQLGLCLQHIDASSCANRISHGLMTIVDLTGFHTLNLEYCGCPSADSLDLQLLSVKVFPASIISPRTGFTFQLLEQFRYIHLEGKTSSSTFINALANLTVGDYFGSVDKQDRGREFRRVARQWNYLVAEKQHGLLDGAEKLISVCPACPNPGINMPADWVTTIPEEKHWLYRSYIHFDANFRLVLEKQRMSSTKEVGLWEGKGFFVENEPYKQYLNTVDSVQQASDCSNYRALSNTSKSRFQSLAITGIEGAVCRHECAIPGSFVNLYKGERYVNSDYAISSALSRMKNLKEVVLSYDIACQYSKNFFDRLIQSPVLQLPNVAIKFLVPKFHLPGHKEDCRFRYSFNYAKGVGRTDGEGIERFWSPHNWLSGSTSKMTESFRLDTLNLHFSDWNLRKSRQMPRYLSKRLRKAQEQAAAHTIQLENFRQDLNKKTVEHWIEQEQRQEKSLGTRSIYQLSTEKAPTRPGILVGLTRMEANQDGDPLPQMGQSALAMWINEGIELENTQQAVRLNRQAINPGSMERDRVLLARRQNLLWCRIVDWRSKYAEDEPGDAPDDEEPGDSPEEEPLMLPSSIPTADRSPQVSAIELCLREGQANDALKTIRMLLAQKLVLRRDKRANVRGTEAITRSNANMLRLESQIRQSVEQYRRAHTAMLALGMVATHAGYRPLNDEDLTYSNVFNDNRSTGRGYEPPVSWIWHMREAGGPAQLSNNWLQEVTRVQFLDMKANKDRWVEEVELLQEELKRVSEWFRSAENAWDRLAHHQHKGTAAYGSRMAAVHRCLKESARKYANDHTLSE